MEYKEIMTPSWRVAEVSDDPPPPLPPPPPPPPPELTTPTLPVENGEGDVLPRRSTRVVVKRECVKRAVIRSAMEEVRVWGVEHVVMVFRVPPGDNNR